MRRPSLRYLLPLFVVLILIIGALIIFWPGDSGPDKPEPIPQGDHTYTKQLAQHLLETLMDDHHIPGAAAALIVDQEIIWSQNFGLADIESEEPVTDNTVFKMWSLAKVFTALETMRLVEDGLVGLDDPLDMHLPNLEIESRFEDGQPITIRHLLAHRSGLPRNNCIDLNEWYLESDALDRLSDSFDNCYLAYPTGERYKYSNAGIDILGYIIQDKRGQIFPPYMAEALFEPLGMSESSFWSSELPAGSQLVTGYEYFEGQSYPYEQYDVATIPSGILYGTASDLANFIRFFFRQGQANGQQLVKPETLEAMYADQYSRPADPQRIGLGWKLSPLSSTETMVWHDGGPSEGVGSLVAMIPERKLGVVLLANSTSFDGSVSVPAAAKLLEAMLETEYGHNKDEDPLPEDYPLDEVDLAKFAGAYTALNDIMTISVFGDRLKGSMQGISFDLIPVAENRFRVDHWLYKFNLDRFLNLPVDLRQLEVEFQSKSEPSDDMMIIDFGGIYYEMCPRYPELPGDMAEWQALAGVYDRFGRLPSGQAGSKNLGQAEITWLDGRLQMNKAIGPILPLDGETLIIQGGPFAGETITRDSASGNLYHQGYVYKPG